MAELWATKKRSTVAETASHIRYGSEIYRRYTTEMLLRSIACDVKSVRRKRKEAHFKQSACMERGSELRGEHDGNAKAVVETAL